MTLPDPLDCPGCGQAIPAGIANLGTEWLWFCEVCPKLIKIEIRLPDEPMDPHVDREKLAGYLRGEVEWETLNSPEQAQIMDFRLRRTL